MEGSRRDELKAALDRHRREELEIEKGRAVYDLPGYCRGCGAEMHNWTVDCDTCTERHRKWFRDGRHPDPAWYERQKERHKAWIEHRRQLCDAARRLGPGWKVTMNGLVFMPAAEEAYE